MDVWLGVAKLIKYWCHWILSFSTNILNSLFFISISCLKSWACTIDSHWNYAQSQQFQPLKKPQSLIVLAVVCVRVAPADKISWGNSYADIILHKIFNNNIFNCRLCHTQETRTRTIHTNFLGFLKENIAYMINSNFELNQEMNIQKVHFNHVQLDNFFIKLNDILLRWYLKIYIIEL